MNFRPILFSAEMVRAILEGRKSQTRRIVSKYNSLTSELWEELDFADAFVDGYGGFNYLRVAKPSMQTRHRVCSKWEVGDVLWCRETWIAGQEMKDGYFVYDEHEHPIDKIWYRADDDLHVWFDGDVNREVPWKPSIHMPKSACRLFLEIKEMRVERVQDITQEDAMAEGAKKMPLDDLGNSFFTYKRGFQSLWEQINGIESWTRNDWVWVLSFRRIERPDNFLTNSK